MAGTSAGAKKGWATRKGSTQRVAIAHEAKYLKESTSRRAGRVKGANAAFTTRLTKNRVKSFISHGLSGKPRTNRLAAGLGLSRKQFLKARSLGYYR